METKDARIVLKNKRKKSKKDGKNKNKLSSIKEDEIAFVYEDCTSGMKKKSKKDGKHKKKHYDINIKEKNTKEILGVVQEKVDVDEDCTRGMKKWLLRYKESRLGLQVLQQRIDEFVIAHEQQQQQERKEREARAAEGGWTTVVHHKGRKKTTDAETGTTFGSVAPNVVIDKMSKKKSKEIALDFYKFHRREAKRNEVMMLQSKFEQDKKRIQQLRATRKFRPY